MIIFNGAPQDAIEKAVSIETAFYNYLFNVLHNPIIYDHAILARGCAFSYSSFSLLCLLRR